MQNGKTIQSKTKSAFRILLGTAIKKCKKLILLVFDCIKHQLDGIST